MSTMEAFRKGLDNNTLVMVDTLRTIISGVHVGLTERIKWNAPSFAIADEDRITLGLERKGGVRVVLHRGAKVKNATDFKFEDTSGLAKWPAPDRGIIIFIDQQSIDANRIGFSDLCRRWLDLTT